MKYKILILSIITFSIFQSCTEVFVDDIEDETVILISPQDSLVTYNNQHLFKWSEIEGAEKYNLQIAKPKFDSLEQLFLDTNLSATQYTFSLNPGKYQWAVKAYNSGYETEYSVYTLQVDSANDFSYLTIELTSPINNYATADTAIRLRWNNLSGADNYYYEICTPDWESEDAVLSGYTQNNYIDVVLPPNNYDWGILAMDNFSQTETPYSVRSFIIDTLRPDYPLPSAPANKDTVNVNDLPNSLVTFKWLRRSVLGSATKDSICIFSDSTLTQPVTQELTADTSFLYSFGSPGVYYWYVRSIDAAGNISNFNTDMIRQFRYEE